MTLASAEQTAQFGRRERRRIDRNGGVEYAEKIRSEGDVVGFPETPLVCASLAGAVMILIASNACTTPIVPTTGPKIPPSAQLTTLSAGGGLGKTHR